MNRIALPLALVLTSSPLLAQSAPVAVQPAQPAEPSAATPPAAVKLQERRDPGVWLGLSLQSRTDGAERLEVLEVLPDSPATRAEFRTGDVLVALGDKPVKTHASLVELLRKRHPGERAKLTVERSQVISLGESADKSHAMLGVVTDDARPTDSSRKRGLPVSDISSQSAAESAGMSPGDRICAVDGKEISTTDELVLAIQAHKPGDKVEIRLQRDLEVRFGEKPRLPGASQGDGQGLFSPDSQQGDFWVAPQKKSEQPTPTDPFGQVRKTPPPPVPGEGGKKRAPVAGEVDQANLKQLLAEIRALRNEVADLRREISRLRPDAAGRDDQAPKARKPLR